MEAYGINLGYLLLQTLICGSLYFLPLILSVKHLFVREDLATSTRNVWLLVLVFAPLIGVILYFVFGRKST